MFGLRGHEPSDYTIPWYRGVWLFASYRQTSCSAAQGIARTMADGRDSTPTDPRFFFLAARGPSLPALPKVSRDRWRQEYSGCSSVLAIVLAELILVHACADPYVPGPPYCT